MRATNSRQHRARSSFTVRLSASTLAAGLASSLCVQCSWAELVAFDDPAAWQAAAGTVTVLDTATIPLGTFADSYWERQGLTFSKMDALGVLAGTQNPNGYNLAELWGVDPETHVMKTWDDSFYVYTPPSARSFSIEVGSLGGPLIVVAFADGTGEWFSFDFGLDLKLDARFAGITVDREIQFIRVLSFDWVGGDNHLSYIKTFAWGEPVPAPSVGAVCLMALVRRGRCRR